MYTHGGIVHIKIFNMLYKIPKIHFMPTLTTPKSYIQWIHNILKVHNFTPILPHRVPWYNLVLAYWYHVKMSCWVWNISPLYMNIKVDLKRLCDFMSFWTDLKPVLCSTVVTSLESLLFDDDKKKKKNCVISVTMQNCEMNDC